ncbi:class I SAM-dependent methyltransferase [Tahibacter amnicola]|uniref:Methyltransferase n=1 Tax=Tahibacter amnicola TaxID=2976241 RepID=A0ABY6BGE8_9GAMM|nr:methyltransferase [Tahibacter amnicola]UXI68150.1 methyltransferase [Tahibacter amnicola]
MHKLALALTISLTLAACGGQGESPKPVAPAAPAAPAAKPVDQPATPTPPQAAGASLDARLDTVLAGSWRSAENKARDAHRHPKETLAFFGLQPGMTVIELTPGGGWYTEILAPLVKGNGKLVAAVLDPATAASEKGKAYHTKSLDNFRAKLAQDGERYADVEVRPFALTTPSFGAPGSADMVLTFRNVHNFMMWNNDAAMFKAAFDVLKPGGVLGVTDHRAAAGADLAKIKDSGYIPEEYVIKLATDAGFTLEGKSEINANPKDTKDYPGGVWSLPPTLDQGDKDREKYVAIGESDRMTLKFVKPAAAGDKVFQASDSAR